MGTKQWTCLLIAFTGLSIASTVSGECDLNKVRTCMATSDRASKMNETVDKDALMERMRAAEATIMGVMRRYNITPTFDMEAMKRAVYVAVESGGDMETMQGMMRRVAYSVMNSMEMPDWMMSMMGMGGVDKEGTDKEGETVTVRPGKPDKTSKEGTDKEGETSKEITAKEGATGNPSMASVLSQMDFTMLQSMVQMIPDMMKMFNMTVPDWAMNMMGGMGEKDMSMRMDNDMRMSVMMKPMIRQLRGMLAAKNVTVPEEVMYMIADMPAKMGKMMAMMNHTDMDWRMMMHHADMMMKEYNVTIPGLNMTELAQFITWVTSGDNSTRDPMVIAHVAQEFLKRMQLPSMLHMMNITVPDWAIPILSGKVNMMAMMNGTEMDWKMMLHHVDMMMKEYNATIPGLDMDELAWFITWVTRWDNSTRDPMMIASVAQHFLKNMQLPGMLQMMNITIPDWAIPMLTGQVNLTQLVGMTAQECWAMHGPMIKEHLAMYNISIDLLELFIPGTLAIIDGDVNITSYSDVWKTFEPVVKGILSHFNVSEDMQSIIPYCFAVMDGQMNVTDLITMVTAPVHQMIGSMHPLDLMSMIHEHVSAMMMGMNMTMPMMMPNVTEIKAMGVKNYLMYYIDMGQDYYRADMAEMRENQTDMLRELVHNMTGGMMDITDPASIDSYLAMVIMEFGSHMREWKDNSTAKLHMFMEQIEAMNATLSQDSEVAFLYNVMMKHNLTQKMMYNWTEWMMDVNVSSTIEEAAASLVQTHEWQTNWFKSMVENYTHILIGKINETVNYIEANKDSGNFFNSLNVTTRITHAVDEYLAMIIDMQSSGLYNNLTSYLGITNPTNLAGLVSDLENLKNSPGSFLTATNATACLQQLITMLQNRNLSELCRPANASDYEMFLHTIIYPMAVADKFISQLHMMYMPLVDDVMAMNLTQENLTKLIERFSIHWHINTELPTLKNWWAYGTVVLTNVVTSYVDISSMISPESIVIMGNMTLADVMKMDLGMLLTQSAHELSMMIDANTLMNQEGLMNLTKMAFGTFQEHSANMSAMQNVMNLMMGNPHMNNVSSALIDIFLTQWFQSSNPFHMYKNETQHLLTYLDGVLELNKTKEAIHHEFMEFNETFMECYKNLTAWASSVGFELPSLPKWFMWFDEDSKATLQHVLGGRNATAMTDFIKSMMMMSSNNTNVTDWMMDWKMEMDDMKNRTHKAAWEKIMDWLGPDECNETAPWKTHMKMMMMKEGNMTDLWKMWGMDWDSMDENEGWMGNMTDMWSEMWEGGKHKMSNFTKDMWEDWEDFKKSNKSHWEYMSDKMDGMWSEMWEGDKKHMNNFTKGMWEDWEDFKKSNKSHWEYMSVRFNKSWESWKMKEPDFDTDMMMRILTDHVLPPFLQAALLGSFEPVNTKQSAERMMDLYDTGMPEHWFRMAMHKMSNMDMSHMMMMVDMMTTMEEMKDGSDEWSMGWMMNKTMGNMTDKWGKMMMKRRDGLMDFYAKMNMTDTWENRVMEVFTILKGNDSDAFNTSDVMGMMEWMKDFENKTSPEHMMNFIDSYQLDMYFPRCNKTDEEDEKHKEKGDWMMWMKKKMSMKKEEDEDMDPKMMMSNWFTSVYVGGYAMHYMQSMMEDMMMEMNATKNMTEDNEHENMMKRCEMRKMEKMGMMNDTHDDRNATREKWVDFEYGMKLMKMMGDMEGKMGKQSGYMNAMASMMMMNSGKKKEDPLRKNIKRAVLFHNVLAMCKKMMMPNSSKEEEYFNIPGAFKEIVQVNKMLEYAKPKLDGDKFDFNSVARHMIATAVSEAFMEEQERYANDSDPRAAMGKIKIQQWTHMINIFAAMAPSFAGDYVEDLGNMTMMFNHHTTLYTILAHEMMVEYMDMGNSTTMSQQHMGLWSFVMSLMMSKEDTSGLKKHANTMMTIYNFAQNTEKQAMLFPALTKVLNSTMTSMAMDNMTWWEMEDMEDKEEMNKTDMHKKENKTMTDNSEAVANCTRDAIEKMMWYMGEKAKDLFDYGKDKSGNWSEYAKDKWSEASEYMGDKAKNATDMGKEWNKTMNEYGEWTKNMTDEWEEKMQNASVWFKNMTGVCDYKEDPMCKNASLNDVMAKGKGMFMMLKENGVCNVMDMFIPPKPTMKDGLVDILSFTAIYGMSMESVFKGMGGYSTKTVPNSGMCGKDGQNFETAVITNVMKLVHTKRLLGGSSESKMMMEMKGMEGMMKNVTGMEMPKTMDDRTMKEDALSALLTGIGNLDLQNNTLGLGSLGHINWNTKALVTPAKCNLGVVMADAHSKMNYFMPIGTQMAEDYMTGMFQNLSMMVHYHLHEITEMAKLDPESRMNLTKRIQSLDFSGFKEIIHEAKANHTEKVEEFMEENMVNMTEALGHEFDMMAFVSVVNVLDKMNFSEHYGHKKLVSNSNLTALASLLAKQKDFNVTAKMDELFNMVAMEFHKYNFSMHDILLNMTAEYRMFDVNETYIQPIQEHMNSVGGMLMWLMKNTSSCLVERMNGDGEHFFKLYSNMSTEVAAKVQSTFDLSGDYNQHMSDFSGSNLTFGNSRLGKVYTAAGVVHMNEKEAKTALAVLNSESIFGTMVNGVSEMVGKMMMMFMGGEDKMSEMARRGVELYSSAGKMSDGGLIGALGRLREARSKGSSEELKQMFTSSCAFSNQLQQTSQCVGNSIDTCNATVQGYFEAMAKPVEQAMTDSVMAAACSAGCEATMDMSECVTMESDASAPRDPKNFPNAKDPSQRTKRQADLSEKGTLDSTTGTSTVLKESDNMCQVFTKINTCVKRKITGCQAMQQSYETTMKPFLQLLVADCGDVVVAGTDSPTEVTTKNNGVTVDDSLGNNGASGLSGQLGIFVLLAALSYYFVRH